MTQIERLRLKIENADNITIEITTLTVLANKQQTMLVLRTRERQKKQSRESSDRERFENDTIIPPFNR